MDPHKSESSIHVAAAPERRCEWRESHRVPVEVTGIDARGCFFTERTSTLDVSHSGCCFLLNAELEENGAVSIRVIRRRNGMMHDDPPVLFRVAWVTQTHPGWPKWTVGVKLQRVQLWTVGFPVEPEDTTGHGQPPADDTPPTA